MALASTAVDGAFELPTLRRGLMGGSLGVGEVGLGARELPLEARSGRLARRVPHERGVVEKTLVSGGSGAAGSS